MSSKSLNTVVSQNRTGRLLAESGLKKKNKVRQGPIHDGVQIQNGVT